MSVRRAGLMLAGGSAFAAVLFARLWSVDEYSWIARDDAVITLSHARNAVDFGSIGVSPGGDRVEGFSSPLQFGVAAVVETVSSPGYRSLSIISFVAAIVLTGVLLTAGFRSLAESLGMSARTSGWASVGLAVGVAAVVTCSWTATGWLGSGMENPWLLASGAALIAAVLGRASSRSARVAAAVGLFALSIGRVEFAAFTVPAIVATGWVAARSARDVGRLRAFAEVVVPPLLGCVIVHLARRVYFGEWLPNTAVVQGRSNGPEQMVGLGVLLLVGLAVVAESAMPDLDRPSVATRRLASGVLRSVTIAGLGAVIWWSASGRTAAPIQDIALFPPLVPLLVVVAVTLQLSRTFGLGAWPPNVVFGMLVAVPLAQYVVMGPARLDGYRVLSLAVPIAVVWLGALVLRFAVVGQTSSAALETSAKVVTVSVVAILAALAGATAWSASNDAPRYLNYAISGTDRVLGAADSVREEHFDGVGLPLLANPDLGKVSFAKRAIVIDLGLLGDPLLTRVVNERNDLMPAFMGRVARPDVVEVHGGFSCAYGAWMATPEFRDAHRSPDEAWSGDPGDDGCFLGGRSAVWFRTDADEEYALTRSIGAAEDPVPVVAEALDQCTRETGDVFRCEGVRRAVQRATPSLRERGRLDAVVEAFGVSPSADLAEPMLRRGPGWADEAFEAFVGLASGP